MLQYPFTLNYLQSLPARARCFLTFTFLSTRRPRALSCSTASQLAGHQPPGYSSPGAGLRTSLCWASRGSCQPISPACWGPCERGPPGASAILPLLAPALTPGHATSSNWPLGLRAVDHNTWSLSPHLVSVCLTVCFPAGHPRFFFCPVLCSSSSPVLVILELTEGFLIQFHYCFICDFFNGNHQHFKTC